MGEKQEREKRERGCCGEFLHQRDSDWRELKARLLLWQLVQFLMCTSRERGT